METVLHFDNGHGTRQYTPSGKQSPDGRIYEGEWNRAMVARIMVAMRELGYDCRQVVPEDQDIPLRERCARVNEAIRREPNKRHLFISVHINAAPRTACDAKGWCDKASGFEVYVSRASSAESRKMALNMYLTARDMGLQGNRAVPREGYWQADYKVLVSTNCPAILTENLFMTNHKEVDYLLSKEGQEAICNLHVLGLCKYLGHPASVIVQ